MKNLLLSSAAIALLATGASAQSWNMDVGGFFVGGIGYADTAASEAIDTNEFALIRDSEINFVAELIADNGITFGVETQLNADDSNNGGASIDENFLYVEGSFGEFQLGEADGAQDMFAGKGLVTPPFATSQDGGGFLFDYLSGESGAGLDNTGSNTSDDLKITYVTPSFAGFSAGVSYVPGRNDKGQVSGRVDDADTFEVGGGYSGEFNGVSVDAGVGYTDNAAPGAAVDSSVGGSVALGYGGFAFGIGYAWTENDIPGQDDRSTLGGGVTYGTGPWTFGVDLTTELENADDNDPIGVAAGASYAVAPGVTAGLTVEYFDPDGAVFFTDANGNAVSTDEESIAVGTWLAVSF